MLQKTMSKLTRNNKSPPAPQEPEANFDEPDSSAMAPKPFRSRRPNQSPSDVKCHGIDEIIKFNYHLKSKSEPYLYNSRESRRPTIY
jgi:hypothetical protein